MVPGTVFTYRAAVIIDARYKSLFIFPAVGVTVILFGVSAFAALLGGNEGFSRSCLPGPGKVALPPFARGPGAGSVPAL